MVEAIRRLSLAQGYPPTIRELASDRDVSKTRVQQVLDRLVTAGVVRRDPTPRGLVLTEAA